MHSIDEVLISHTCNFCRDAIKYFFYKAQHENKPTLNKCNNVSQNDYAVLLKMLDCVGESIPIKIEDLDTKLLLPYCIIDY